MTPVYYKKAIPSVSFVVEGGSDGRGGTAPVKGIVTLVSVE